MRKTYSSVWEPAIVFFLFTSTDSSIIFNCKEKQDLKKRFLKLAILGDGNGKKKDRKRDENLKRNNLSCLGAFSFHLSADEPLLFE